MESVPEKNLTSEEKTKLEERLALLKKEYKKTVHRLQRSQRAERVKTHVKRTIEEQNRLLSQEVSNQENGSRVTGPLININDVSGKATESTQGIDTPTSDKERKPSVSFNLDPEILHGEKRSPSCSGSESSGQERSAASPTGASGSSNPVQSKRSRLRLNKSVRRSRSEPVSPGAHIHCTVNGLEGQNNVLETGSTRSSMFPTEDEAPKIQETTHVSPGCENDLGLNVLAQQRSMETTNPPMSPVFKKEDVATTIKLSQEGMKHLYPEEKATLDTGQSQGVTIDDSPGDQDDRNTKAAHCNTNSIDPSLAGDQSPSVTKFLGGTSQDLSLLQVVETSSTSPPGSGNHSAPTDKNQGETSLMEEERNPLDSCTLVEGLLFPVEYYVRTTRRMTSCQRKVDLDAVIHSHLGTARKGARGRPRRASISSAFSPQVRGTPVSTPRPRRGRGRKSCPASVSSDCDNISMQLKFDSDINVVADGSQDVKETFEEKEGSIKTGAETQDTTEGLRMEGVTLQPKGRRVHGIGTQEGGSPGLHASARDKGELPRQEDNIRTSRETYEPRSPLPLRSRRLNLPHILRHLDVTDFHLPDEDFGVLKLKKLKSASDLEPFVPEPSRAKRKYRWAYSTERSPMPATDTSAALRGAVRGCTSTSQGDLKRWILRKTCPKGDRKQASVGDTGPLHLEASRQDGVASPTLLTRETAEVFDHSPSEDNGENYGAGPLVNQSPEPCAAGPPVNHSLEACATGPPVNHSPEACVAGPPVNHSSQRTHRGAPQSFADWKSTYSNAEVSNLISQGSLCPGPNAPPTESLQGLTISRTCTGSDEPTNSPSETKQPPNVPSASKELSCSVLLSTSICSLPVDTPAECISSGCTPTLPILGSTPAVFPSPQGSSSPIPCKENRRTAQFPTEESLPSNVGALVTQDRVDPDPYSEILLPPSGDAAQVWMEKEPCRQQEHEGNAARSDQCNTEGILARDHLHLISEIKDTCAGGCPVDLCSVWWEFSGCEDLCVVSASEYSVCLWRPQEACKWQCVQTWNFTEMPVIQILPLFQEKNMVCVALGNLEIMEIWVLSSHPETNTWEKHLVKRGQIKTAQGLSRQRVVSGSGGADRQLVELWQLSHNGSVAGSHTLVAPKDSVVAFSEVDGERDALVGSTVDNNLVLWNSVTGHLLSTFHIGGLCSDLACISATSDSGLLFFIIGSWFSKPCEISGSCIFRLIAINPRGGASAFIMAYTLPEGMGSRYLEGDVKKQRAAAVLTCGSIAFWDLSRSYCSAVLPPDSNTPWCLVRWGNKPSCLLAGRKDGTICVYEYTQHVETPYIKGISRTD